MADWTPGDPEDEARAKWVQLPDLSATGLDVLDTLQPNPTPPPQWKILADDFLCEQSGPITDVHIWGSWLNDNVPRATDGTLLPGSLRFKLSFHDDVPDPNPTDPADYSHPADPALWERIFEPGDFVVNSQVITAPENFYDPNLDQIIGPDNLVFQYNFTTIPDPFIQTAGKIYWLDVQTEVFTPDQQPTAVFGWKTRDPSLHYNDDAVFADTNGFAGALITPWRELRYPVGHDLAGKSIDLSFVLTVPEPSSIGMACLGLVVLLGVAYRRRGSSRR